jgi:hypothetical protein
MMKQALARKYKANSHQNSHQGYPIFGPMPNFQSLIASGNWEGEPGLSI